MTGEEHCEEQKRAARRRLVRGGLAAGSVLAMLKSKPLLAQTCQSVSGFISSNPSLNPNAPNPCTGLTPSQWAALPQQQPFPSPYKRSTQLDDQAAFPLATRAFKTMKFDQALAGVAQDPLFPAGYLVAALLNNAAGRVPEFILPRITIQEMGNAILSGNLYQAAPGVPWTGADVVAYLKQTML